MKVQLIVALTGAALSAGCVLPSAPYPYANGVAVPAQGVVVDEAPPVEFYEPSVIIVENGIPHDRYYYQRHPDVYRFDMRRYPERFNHGPHGPGPGPSFHGHDGPGPRYDAPRNAGPGPRYDAPRNAGPGPQRGGNRNGAPAAQPDAATQLMMQKHYDHAKKKKNHDDDHR